MVYRVAVSISDSGYYKITFICLFTAISVTCVTYAWCALPQHGEKDVGKLSWYFTVCSCCFSFTLSAPVLQLLEACLLHAAKSKVVYSELFLLVVFWSRLCPKIDSWFESPCYLSRFSLKSHFNNVQPYCLSHPFKADINIWNNVCWFFICKTSTLSNCLCVNFSDLLQQIYKNCNNSSKEGPTRPSDADNGFDITDKINRCFIQSHSCCR